MDLDRHPESAAAAPKSYYLEMPDHIYFAGGKIGRNGLTIHIGLGCPDGLEYSKAVDTEWINGCAMMIRRGALLEVGLFDPRFFLLFEDTDWSVRARTAGYRLRFVPEAKLWHKVSPSFGSTRSPLYLYYATRNLFLWIEKSFPLPQRIALFCFGLKRECFRTIIRTRNPADESAHRQRMAIWQGIWDYVLRRFGPQRM
jgi:GT2 family glycosyltransferase